MHEKYFKEIDLKIVEKGTYGCETVASGVIKKFAKTHKLADPILVPIRLGGLTGSGDAQQCHTNALILAYRYGGFVLNGYYTDRLLGKTESKHSVLWGHSVWVTPEGNAVCPTSHNIKSNETHVQFIPCIKHDWNTVRDFFENGASPIVCRNIVFSWVDDSYVLALHGEENDQVGSYTKMTKIQWKRVLKSLTKKGLAGKKKNPLRNTLLTKRSFKSDVTLEWLLEEKKQDFLFRVLPNLPKGGLDAA